MRDWRTRLVAWSASLVGRPFKWGETDCGSIARAAMVECFGEDVMPECPQWKSSCEAKEVLKDFHPLTVLERLKATRTTVAFARGGDIVLLPASDVVGDVALGVWIDGSCLITSRDGGVQLIPAAEVPRDSIVYSVWEIPDGESR